jgi:hypothetical protein
MKKRRGYLIILVTGMCSLGFLASIVLARIVATDRLFVVNSQSRVTADQEALSKLYKMMDERLESLEEPEEPDDSLLRFEIDVQREYTHSSINAIVGLGQTVRRENYSVLGADLDLDFVEGNLDVSVEALGTLVIEDLVGGESLLFGSEDWRNQTWSGEVTLAQGTGIGFWVRARREGDTISGYLVEYSLLDSPTRGGTFRISRVDQGVSQSLNKKYGSDLGIGGLAWLIGIQHSFTVGADQERISLEVDGREILTAEDPDPIRGGKFGYKPGLAGIVLVHSARVDNLIEIRSLCRTH